MKESSLIIYAKTHSSALPALATRVMRRTASSPFAYLLVGEIIGNLLRCLVAVRKPQFVLEIGSFTGYSAAMILSSLPQEAKLWVVEDNPDRYGQLCANLAEEIAGKRVTAISRDGFEWLQEQTLAFDMIFLDGRKEDYPNRYNLLKARLSPGGILAVDNSLYKGRVLAPERPWEYAIDQFNKILSRDPEMTVALLPIRDGFTVAVKSQPSQGDFI